MKIINRRWALIIVSFVVSIAGLVLIIVGVASYRSKLGIAGIISRRSRQENCHIIPTMRKKWNEGVRKLERIICFSKCIHEPRFSGIQKKLRTHFVHSEPYTHFCIKVYYRY